MDDELKRRQVGVCCYSCLGLVATAAFGCAIYSYAWCDFVKRYVVLAPGVDPTTACSELGYNGSLSTVCETMIGTQGIGFEGFWVTVPVDQQMCLTYSQPTPW